MENMEHILLRFCLWFHEREIFEFHPLMLVQIRINSIVVHSSRDEYEGNRLIEVSEIVMKRPSEIPKQSSSDPCRKSRTI